MDPTEPPRSPEPAQEPPQAMLPGPIGRGSTYQRMPPGDLTLDAMGRPYPVITVKPPKHRRRR